MDSKIDLKQAAVGLLSANGIANERLNFIHQLIETGRFSELSVDERHDLASGLLTLETVFEQLCGTMEVLNEVRKEVRAIL